MFSPPCISSHFKGVCENGVIPARISKFIKPEFSEFSPQRRRDAKVTQRSKEFFTWYFIGRPGKDIYIVEGTR
jgi:hypothetical protein